MRPMNEFKIDQEFAEKIPPMPKEQFDGLRADILRDGYIRDPLVVWQEENTLLDGHHRWKVISEFPEKFYGKYSIVYQSLPDRWAAIAWICANQLHKHNMDGIQQAKLIQEEYEARQKSWETYSTRDENGRFRSGENHHFGEVSFITGEEISFEYKTGKETKTRAIVAKEHNMSENLVREAVETGRGIDRGEAVVPGFKNDVLTGAVKATKRDLAALRKMDDDEEVKAAIDKIKSPKEKPKRIVQKSSDAVAPWEDESKSEYAKTRELAKEIRRVNEEMASGKPNSYTQHDLVLEIRSLCEDFLRKVQTALRVREKYVGNGEAVIEELENCERELVKIESEIGGKAH